MTVQDVFTAAAREMMDELDCGGELEQQDFASEQELERELVATAEIGWYE
jgi:hypothetical protein